MNRPPLIRLYEGEISVDNFAGGGGASTGIEMAIGRSPDVAINHDLEALAMHAENHPKTEHIKTDVFEADPVTVTRGRPVGLGWFSPDCTDFSKAKGGKPFRDVSKARRKRGVAWVVVKWARAPLPVRPRVMICENVEEFLLWGAVRKDGTPDPKKRGRTFRRWENAIKAAGYAMEWRELRASPYGAPTSRKRLVIVMRRDGLPIAWPVATHGPHLSKPFRTAAECIDFSLPVPSIFLTPAEAKAWGREYGVAPPKRPLANATLRRVGRGVWRFVIDSPEPFIIKYHGGDRAERIHALDEPLRTLDTSNRFALVTPYLVNVRHDDERMYRATEPLRTIPASDREIALVAPTLIQTGYGERTGQAPRSLDLFEPLGTIVGCGGRHALVAAFLAKHNGGHEATGQRLQRPTDTITTRDQKALVTSHLVKLYGTCQDGQTLDRPMPTVTAHGNHIAEVRAFLVKYYGSKKDGNQLAFPIDTVTTKERFGLVVVTIAGDEYVIVDIGMRMLTPRELFRCQGFPDSYQIQDVIHPTLNIPMRLTKKAQTRLVGNSVPPHLAAAIIGANFSTRQESAA